MYKFKSYDLGLVLILFGLIAVVVKSDKTLQVIDIKSDMTILRPISEQTGNQPNSLITSIQEEKKKQQMNHIFRTSSNHGLQVVLMVMLQQIVGT